MSCTGLGSSPFVGHKSLSELPSNTDVWLIHIRFSFVPRTPHKYGCVVDSHTVLIRSTHSGPSLHAAFSNVLIRNIIVSYLGKELANIYCFVIPDLIPLPVLRVELAKYSGVSLLSSTLLAIWEYCPFSVPPSLLASRCSRPATEGGVVERWKAITKQGRQEGP